MTVLPLQPPDPSEQPVPLLRWKVGRGPTTRWHAEARGDRWSTLCGIRVPAGAKVRRRSAYAGHWPEMCGGCKAEIVRGAA